MSLTVDYRAHQQILELSCTGYGQIGDKIIRNYLISENINIFSDMNTVMWSS